MAAFIGPIAVLGGLLSGLFGGGRKGPDPHLVAEYQRLQQVLQASAANFERAQRELRELSAKQTAAEDESRRLAQLVTASQEQRQAAEAQAQQLRGQVTELERPTRWKRMAPAELWDAANERLRLQNLQIEPQRINIAFVGPSGAGKSSTINALLSRLALPGAPPPTAHVSGLASEGTTALRRFDVPGTSISLWDVPGGGTSRFSAAAYVEEQCLAVFDQLVLLIDDRLLELHCDILKASTEKFPRQNVKVVFAKGDARVTAARMDVPGLEAAVQQQVVERIKGSVVQTAAANRHTMDAAHVFVISSWLLGRRRQPDELGLMGSLEEDRFLMAIMTAAAESFNVDPAGHAN